MKKCPFCAEEIQDAAIVCRFCHADLARGVSGAQATRTASPGVAAVLSLVIPGAGQMYAGRIGAGLLWLIVVLMFYVVFIPLGAILHLACVVTAASSLRPSAARVSVATPVVVETSEQLAQRRRNNRFLLGLTSVVILGGVTTAWIQRTVAQEARVGLVLSVVQFYDALNVTNDTEYSRQNCQASIGAYRLVIDLPARTSQRIDYKQFSSAASSLSNAEGSQNARAIAVTCRGLLWQPRVARVYFRDSTQQ